MNPHGHLGHEPLKPTRLPIPPPRPRIFNYTTRSPAGVKGRGYENLAIRMAVISQTAATHLVIRLNCSSIETLVLT